MERDAVRHAGIRRAFREQRGAQAAEAFRDMDDVAPAVPDRIGGPALLRRVNQGFGGGLDIRENAVAAVLVLHAVAEQADVHVAPFHQAGQQGVLLHGKGPEAVHKQADALEQAAVVVKRLGSHGSRGARFGAAGLQQGRICTQDQGELAQLVPLLHLRGRVHKCVVRDIAAGQLPPPCPAAPR